MPPPGCGCQCPPHPTIPQTSRHPARVRPRGAIPAQAAKCTPDQRQAPQILRSRARSEETDGAPKILMAPAVSSLHARALDAHSGFFTCCRGVFLHLLSGSVSSIVVGGCFFTVVWKCFFTSWFLPQVRPKHPEICYYSSILGFSAHPARGNRPGSPGGFPGRGAGAQAACDIGRSLG